MKNHSFHVSCSVAYNPKIAKLKRIVGSPGCWSLVCLWAYTAAHRPDGILLDMTASEIEQVAGWQGKKGKFYNALVACGLLDIDDGFAKVHEWELHNPWQTYAKERTERAQRAALSRWHSDPLNPHSPSPKRKPGNARSNAHTTPKNNARSNARSIARSNAHSINHSPAIDNPLSELTKPSSNGHSPMPGALLEHDELQYNPDVLAEFYQSSTTALADFYHRSTTAPPAVESGKQKKTQQFSSSQPSDQKSPENATFFMPDALLNPTLGNATSIKSDAPSIAQASKSGDAYIKGSECSDPPPPTPPCGWGQREGEQPFVSTENAGYREEPGENPETPMGSGLQTVSPLANGAGSLPKMPSGSQLQRISPGDSAPGALPQMPDMTGLQGISPGVHPGGGLPQTPTESQLQQVYPADDKDNGGTSVLEKPEWDGDSGFPKWLARLWNWEVPRVMQYLRKARRDSTTAFDASGFYRDYLREQRQPQADTRIDWLSHPNFAAYNARCAEDCYQFLLEFPSGSPERSLRASFVQWFLSQPKSPQSSSQIPQEAPFIPSLVLEDDYDF